MAQPDMAAGGDGNPADANPATPFEEIAADMLGEDQEEEEQPAEAVEEEAPEEAEPETDEEAVDEEDIEPEEEIPAIEPPNSLTAEEKEAFKNLPREAQEFTARRIGEMEKGFQSKAQEFAQQKQALQSEVFRHVEQIKAQTAETLQKYAQQFETKPPSAELFRTNPEAYAQQLEAHQYYTAQREQAQREAEAARAEQAQLQQAREAQEAQEFHQRLAAELPEAFDPENGQKFLQELAATAEILGFDPNQISDVSAMKALKATSEWKAKADKYDSLMKKKMQRVREGKNPPPITRPGTARAPEATQKARADAAWKAAQSAKSRNAKDEALATWMESTGWL
jgi:hypothetical protein